MAEESGYDSLWAGDHVSFHNPILDVTVALTQFAAATERIAIGAGGRAAPAPAPALVAREFASLDYLSGGRVVLGVGVGGEGGKDFEAVGVDPRERGARTDEAMLVLRDAVRRAGGVVLGPVLLLRGHHDRASRAAGRPAALGGRAVGGGAASCRPARRRLDADLGLGRAFAEGLAEVRRHAEEAGRDPAAIAAAVVCPALRRRATPRAAARCTSRAALRHGGEAAPVDRYCVAGSAEECAARVREYADAGAEHMIFNIGCAAGDELLDQAQRLASLLTVEVS